ncbi:MAG: hypothetical protein IKI13_09340 [Bacteroidales bacterium]|nr:hypothetical protein [Bacteroidales bacterium]
MKQDITQQSLAEASGVSLSSLKKNENGESRRGAYESVALPPHALLYILLEGSD